MWVQREGKADSVHFFIISILLLRIKILLHLEPMQNYIYFQNLILLQNCFYIVPNPLVPKKNMIRRNIRTVI